jgi:hypothetical protein
MSDRRDSLSPTAVLLLGAHRPGEPAYHSWALGLPRSPNGLGPIDEAYDELVERGLLEPAGLPVPVLPGVIRDSFILPAAGENRLAGVEEPAEVVDFLPRDYPGAPASVDLPAEFLPSVDMPAGLTARPATVAASWSFRQAVRVGLGLGVGFWAVGLAVLGVVSLAVSLSSGPDRAPTIPVVAPAGGPLAAASTAPR